MIISAASASRCSVDLGAQVVEVDVAGRARWPRRPPASRPSPPTPRWCRARYAGIRQTSRCVVAAAAVVGGDREQAGELALAARVGLQRHRRVAGELGQPALQVGDQLAAMPAASSRGANGCRSANSGQVIGSISAAALSFIVHEPSGIIVRSSARSASASRRSQRISEVSRAVLVEHRVRQVLAGRGAARPAARRRCRRRARRRRRPRRTRPTPPPGGPRSSARSRRCRRVSASTRRSAIPAACAASTTAVGPARHPRLHGVEERAVHDLHPAGPQPGGQHGGHPVGRAARSGAARPGRGRRRSRRRRRPAAPARCRCSRWPSRGGCAARGSAAPAAAPGCRRRRGTCPTSRPGSCRASLSRTDEVAGVRAAEAQRHPEALGGADGDVRAQLAGRGEQGQRQQVGGHGDQRAALVRGRRSAADGSRTAPDAPG